VQNPVLDITTLVLRDEMSENASGADNQQERLSIDRIPVAIGNFLSGFALGEGSFMIVCRPRVDYRRGWKLSAAFNVSQADVTPLELFREQLGCGTIRKAGNDGWYLELNTLGRHPVGSHPILPQVPDGGPQGCRLRTVRGRVEHSQQEAADRWWLSRGAAVERRIEQRRQTAIHDGKNPQRLYAELFSRKLKG
jgi:hypothetical protein